MRVQRREPLTYQAKRDVASRKRANMNQERQEEAKREVRRRNRFRPGTLAIREIKFYQSTTRLLLQRAPF